MSADNPLWGAPRIHGELLKLGFEVAQSTVSKYMVRLHGGPSGQSWWTFLRNHAPEIAAMDLFVVPTLAFDLLYGFIIVRLDRRELVHIAVTNSPTADWIARQITEAFPWDTAPGYLIRDRDCVFGSIVMIHPSRMPGPDHCLRRGASAPDSALLRELLQQSSDAPVTQQRRAGASSDSAPWRPKVTSCSRWTTSPIRPNLMWWTAPVPGIEVR